MEVLTTDQVLALAPDAASVKAGQGLSNPGKWVSLGREGRSVWGECQGSGKDPYRTQADLSGPAFHCSCPSRKFPCKHGLGLLLLLAAQPARVPEIAPPAWVSEWLAKRQANAEKKAARVDAADAPVDPATQARREAGREKRAAQREDRVQAGLADLQTWLSDLARQGLAHVQQQPAHLFHTMAARMIDAQAPGVARRLRRWPGILVSGDRWADRALAEMGTMQLLLHGASQLDALPEPMRASVRQAIGWSVSEQELAAAEGVRDQWQIVGQVIEEEENLRVQRTWLIGAQTGRPALSLSFATLQQPLDITLRPGTMIDAELAFHPSAAPLRALVRSRQGEARPLAEPTAAPHFEAALAETAALLAGDPWLERTPWLVRDCLPYLHEGAWHLRDAASVTVPLGRWFAHAWPLLALSGGGPVTVFGEWDGEFLTPLSAMQDARFIPFGALPT